MYAMSHTTPRILTQHQQRVAAERGRDLGDDLHDLYITRGLNLRDLATELGIDKATAQRWLYQFGIDLRAPGRRAS